MKHSFGWLTFWACHLNVNNLDRLTSKLKTRPNHGKDFESIDLSQMQLCLRNFNAINLLIYTINLKQYLRTFEAQH